MNSQFHRQRNTLTFTANGSLTKDQSGSLVTNYGASGTITVNLPLDCEVNDLFFIGVGAAQALQINPPDADVIVGLGTSEAAGKYIWADDEGESIVIQKIASGIWLAYAPTGTWTVEA